MGPVAAMLDCMAKKTEAISIKITPETHMRLKQMAKRQERSKSALVDQYIRAGLSRDEGAGRKP